MKKTVVVDGVEYVEKTEVVTTDQIMEALKVRTLQLIQEYRMDVETEEVIRKNVRVICELG